MTDALMITPTQIVGVSVLEQHGDKAYNFVLTAEALIALTKVEHFGQDSEGVNRKFNQSHAVKIAEAMLDPRIMWLEPILGDLRGTWTYENGILTYEEGGYISVDDGQHRRAALEMLNREEFKRLSFNVTATLNLPYERRLRIFRMQGNRKQIDARLDLAQRYKLDEWRNAAEKEAYGLVITLNGNPNSPLFGKILLEEQAKRPHEGRNRPLGINAKGLMSTMRMVVGGRSPLQQLSESKRMEVIMNMIHLAAETWKPAWNSDKHILTTARGINAILMLFVSSPNFRGALGDDFSVESLRRALELAKSFDWSSGKHKNADSAQIVDRINQSIGRNAKLSKAA